MEYCLSISRQPCSPLSPVRIPGGSCAYCGLPGGALGLEEHKPTPDTKIKLCPICHCGLHLDRLGASPSPMGDIVYLPELTQKQVNLLWIGFQVTANRQKQLEKQGTEEQLARIGAIYNRLKACDADIRNRMSTVQNMLKGDSAGSSGQIKPIIPKEELSKPWIFAGFMEQILSEVSNTSIPEVEIRRRLSVFKFYPAMGAFDTWVLGVGANFLERFAPEDWTKYSKEYMDEKRASDES